MTGIYLSLTLMALIPLLVVSGLLTKADDPDRVHAGLALLALCTLAAVAVAAYAAATSQWMELPLAALALLAITMDWDMTIARLRGRLPKLTPWLIGVRWGSSTNRRRPPS
ncbi:hypothetical protein [Phytohabitans houttuyneae]|uniref:Uncharacterized protein n=1 Tax=Phytohabitans houttuyneae TaxID=1076126 RepID=A0A6V8K7C1_9ACTN|nr:hypothetical protein [Phytohabitans houttuyneae]GFJ79420.1 hypothetical protein Phou_036000 [Phytohabitans houttuyneae]